MNNIQTNHQEPIIGNSLSFVSSYATSVPRIRLNDDGRLHAPVRNPQCGCLSVDGNKYVTGLSSNSRYRFRMSRAIGQRITGGFLHFAKRDANSPNKTEPDSKINAVLSSCTLCGHRWEDEAYEAVNAHHVEHACAVATNRQHTLRELQMRSFDGTRCLGFAIAVATFLVWHAEQASVSIQASNDCLNHAFRFVRVSDLDGLGTRFFRRIVVSTWK